jgi:hypothetical protein
MDSNLVRYSSVDILMTYFGVSRKNPIGHIYLYIVFELSELLRGLIAVFWNTQLG